MGLFSKIKELFSAKALILRAIEEQEKKYTALSELPPEELIALSDADLLGTVNFCIDREIASRFEKPFDFTLSERICDLSSEKQTVYILSWYNDLMLHGGLFEFFSSEDRVFAPRLEELLLEVNAPLHRALYHSFFEANALDPNDLSAFAIENAAISDAWQKRYPFAEFDEAYVKLPELEALLSAYIRDRIDRFI